MEDTLQTHEFCEAHQSFHEDQPKLLFVGGLSLETTDILLVQHFSQFGSVTSVQIQRRSSGKSKGFAYLQFVCPENASRAISIKNQIVLGSVITVQLALTQEQKKVLEGTKLKRKIFVSFIPSSFDASRVCQYFSRVGPVESVIQLKAKPMSNWKTGFVIMKTQESASQICSGKRLVIDGITFGVKPFMPSIGTVQRQTAPDDPKRMVPSGGPAAWQARKPTANAFKPNSQVQRLSESQLGRSEFKSAVSKLQTPKMPGKSVTDADFEIRSAGERSAQVLLKIRPGLHISLASDKYSMPHEAPAKHTFIVRDRAKMQVQLVGSGSQMNECSQPNLVFNVGKW